MDAQSTFIACTLRVRGLVQGVGFRPHVWKLAKAAGLVGTVRNDAQGVLIELAGDAVALATFEQDLRQHAPALSRIDAIERQVWLPDRFPDAFSIVESKAGKAATGVVPDAATCPDCLADITEPTNRRYGYPFTNCTHCGPRLTIIRQVPYDRASTAMAPFTMCPACAADYEDPADRRFHAQPNACPDCGPQLWLEGPEGNVDADPLAAGADMLRAGRILAIKGLGGFHLACDATNEAAVQRLRTRKRRNAKPLAIMVRDLAQARQLCEVSEQDAEALSSPQAPIVLLTSKACTIAPSVALEQRHLGIMLPYTPLHHLLLRACDGPLVMTSGNKSDEPQAISNDDARAQLGGIADAFLMHDREIVNRVDDSVGRVEQGAFRLMRRARGFAPAPLAYPAGFATDKRVIAMGSALKNSFALTTPDGIVVGPHCGDLDNPQAARAYREGLALFQRLYDVTPEMVCVDSHPDYFPTTTGSNLARDADALLVRTNHHHAHIASVLGDAGYRLDGPPVIGVALDGLGLGPDGTLWGGEVLVADYRSAERVAGLPSVALPGGERASREPWRNLIAHLHAAGLDPLHAGCASGPTGLLVQMIERGLNAPGASSAGRLFDAFAALLGRHADRVGFEGQAAMALEALAGSGPAENGYPVALVDHACADTAPPCLAPFWRAALHDKAAGAAPSRMAMRFHRGLASAFADEAVAQAKRIGASTVALSGGVFQNMLLKRLMVEALRAQGLQVLCHRQVPANDGGLAFGQLLIGLAVSQ